eukprot:gb/GECH01012523.1/.p1 GENE.gb/GECH01012523.1/~~gb/GECH01012523.1/.p1  ORF type:complete len:216 (+),score=66.48 gb/GECH01012523.1/:1-648(+)
MSSTAELETLVKKLSEQVSKLEKQVERLEKVGGGGGGEQGGAASVTAFEEFLENYVKPFKELSDKIGGDVAEIGKLTEKAFQKQHELIKKAVDTKKPSPEKTQELLTPLSSCLQEISSFRDSHRTSENFNHLSAVSEAAGMLGWVAVDKTPVPYIKEVGSAGDFYGNKVRMAYKDKDATHVEWIKAWNAIITNLQAYVKEYHTTGLAWNPQGQDP